MIDLLDAQVDPKILLANSIKDLDDVILPKLDAWNYDACVRHADVGPQVDCQYRACGGDLFSHQRVGVAWLYAIQHGLLADDPGLAKTGQILALLSLLKQRGELTRRAVIIPNTPAVNQWREEAERWTPGLRVLSASGLLTKEKRLITYAKAWDVLIVGSHIAINDVEELSRLAPFDLVASDDVDPILKHSNATARAVVRISDRATRSYTVNATTLQVRMEQLHAAFVPIGGVDTFGTQTQFERQYYRQELVADPITGRMRMTHTGFKNIPELREKVSNLHIRRRATELTDVRMPMLMPPTIEWFEMSPQQRAKYEELQQEVLVIMREEGPQVKRMNALTKYTYGQQICAGLPALGEPDGPGASPKLDRLFERLNSVWADRKTIVFVKNVGMVKAAIQRAQEQNIGMAMVWGQNQNAQQRSEQVAKFWDDPECRFLIGTTALERSLNLQVANTVVALDTHMNPARMRQLLGRAKRAGSPHERVFFFSFFMAGTQEERILRVLAERQALNDTIFGDVSEMYEPLSPLELLQVMGPH